MNRRIAAVLCLALFLRVPFLYNPLWGDEIVTLRFISNYDTVGLIIQLPLHQPHFPIYYIVIDPLGSAQAGRVVSLVASIALVYCTYELGQRMYGETTGVYASLLVALSPVMVLHGTWLRMYSLLALLFVASILAFIERRDRLWAVSCVLIVWIHPFGMFILVGYLAYALVNRDRDALIYSVIPLLASIPGAALLVLKVIHPVPAAYGGYGTAGLIHELDPTVLSASALYGSLLTGRVYTEWQLGTALFVSACVLWYAYKRRDVTAYLLIVPVAVTVALSITVRPVFQMKYLAFLAPLVAVYFGMFLTNVPRRQRIILGGALLLNYAIAYYAMILSRSPWMGLRVL